MRQKSLAVWLRVIMAIVSVVAAIFLFWVMPVGVKELSDGFPEFAYLTLPGLVCIWASAIPVGIAIVSFYKIIGEIGRDNSFCEKNAKNMKVIGIMALIDTGLTILVLAMLALGSALNFSAILLIFTIIIFGLTIAILALALSHLVLKASKLREDNELTI